MMMCPDLPGWWKSCPQPLQTGLSENEIQFFAFVFALMLIGLVIGITAFVVFINNLIN